MQIKSSSKSSTRWVIETNARFLTSKERIALSKWVKRISNRKSQPIKVVFQTF